MSEGSQNHQPQRRRHRLNELILRLVGLGAQIGPGFSVGILLSVLTLIGLIDYYTGVFLSLAPLYVVPITLAVAWVGWRTGCVLSLLSVVVREAGDLAAGGYPISADKVF